MYNLRNFLVFITLFVLILEEYTAEAAVFRIKNGERISSAELPNPPRKSVRKGGVNQDSHQTNPRINPKPLSSSPTNTHVDLLSLKTRRQHEKESADVNIVEVMAAALREIGPFDPQILPTVGDGEKKSKKEYHSIAEALYAGLFNNSQGEDLKSASKKAITEIIREHLLAGAKRIASDDRKSSAESSIPANFTTALVNNHRKDAARKHGKPIAKESAAQRNHFAAFTKILASQNAADKRVSHVAVNRKSHQGPQETKTLASSKMTVATNLLNKATAASRKKFSDCPCPQLVSLDQSANQNSALTAAGLAVATLSIVAKCETKATISCTVARGLAPILRFRYAESSAGKNVIGDVGDEAVENVECNRETGRWQRTNQKNTTFNEYACFADNSDDSLKDLHESDASNQTIASTATVAESDKSIHGETKRISASVTVTAQACICDSLSKFEKNPQTPGVVAGISIINQANDTNGCPSSAQVVCAAPDELIPKILLVREGNEADQSIIAGKPKNPASQEFKCSDSGHWQSKEANVKIASFGCFYTCPCPPLATLEQLWIDGSQSPGTSGTFNNTQHGCENLAIVTCAVSAGRKPRLSFQFEDKVAGENTVAQEGQSALEPVNCNTQTGFWQRSGKNNLSFDKFSCFSTGDEEPSATLIPQTASGSSQIGLNVPVASLIEANIASSAHKSSACTPFGNLASTSKDPSRNAGNYAILPLYETDGLPSSFSTITLTCSAPSGHIPQLLLIRSGQNADKKIVSGQIEGRISEKFTCADGVWSSKTFGNIDSFQCFYSCPCSPMSSLNIPGSEEEMMRGGEVSVRASANLGCENEAIIRCSVVEGLLPVLSYRLQGVKAGENTVGFVKDVEDIATCDSVTGTWMRTYDNNSAFSEFSCFAQEDENVTTSTVPVTTSATEAPKAVVAEALPAVCLKDQSAVTYTLKEVKQFSEGEKTVILYEIGFKNNGATKICGGNLVYYIDQQEATIIGGSHLIPVGSFEVFPPRFVFNKDMYKTPDFMKIAAGESRQDEVGLYVSRSADSSSSSPVICTVSLTPGNC